MELSPNELETLRVARTCCGDSGKECDEIGCAYTDGRGEEMRFCRQWVLHDLIDIIDRLTN